MIRIKLSILLLVLFSVSANAVIKPHWVSGNIFKTNYFIQNKGQFDAYSINRSQVEYALENGSERYYFSTAGYTSVQCYYEEPGGLAHLLHLRPDDLEEKNVIRKESKIIMHWLGSNPVATIQAENQSKHYFSYGDAQLKSYGFSSITYKDLYPGIDVIYTIPDKGGIKYSLMLHPGADISQVRFYFDGTPTVSTTLNDSLLNISNAKFQLNEMMGDVYYANGSKVRLHYAINHGIIRFIPEQQIDNSKQLIIDPWVTRITTLTSNQIDDNTGMYVDYDLSGSLYVYGGGYPNDQKVAKYDTYGNLLWTFMGVIPSIFWSSAPWSGYPSNFVVNRLDGKVYIGQLNSVGAIAVRLNSAGLYDNFKSVGDPSFREMWRLEFSCDSSKLRIFGGGTNSNFNFLSLDTVFATGALRNLTNNNSGFDQDVSDIVMLPNGQADILFNSSVNTTLDNRVVRSNSNFNTPIWVAPCGLTSFSEASNVSFISGGGIISNTTKALAANMQHVFVYDGKSVSVLDNSNGNLLPATYTFSTQLPLHQSGAFATSCDDLFLGTAQSGIQELNLSGTVLSPVNTIPIPGLSKAIYDLKYNYYTNAFYISGDSFVAVIPHTINCAGTWGSLNLSTSINCPSAFATVHVAGATAFDQYNFVWVDTFNHVTVRNVISAMGVADDTFTIQNWVPNLFVYVIQYPSCQSAGSNIVLTFANVKNFTYNYCNTLTPFQLPNGHIVHAPGVFYDTVKSSTGGCDTFYRFQLNYNYSFSVKSNFTACSDTGYTLPNGQVAHQSGLYCIDTIKLQNNCDSIIMVNVIIIESPTRHSYDTTCYNTRYILPWGDTVWNAGTYNKSFPIAFGCDSQLVVHLYQWPQTVVVKDIKLCKGVDTYTLPSGATTDSDTSFRVVYTDKHGCDSIRIYNVQFVLPPLFTLGPDTTLCLGDTFHIRQIPSNATLLWGDGDTSRLKLLTEDGNYIISLNVAPCPAVTDSIYLTYIHCDGSVNLPNAFTPNNDQQNDSYKARARFHLYSFQLLIFPAHLFGQIAPLMHLH